MSRTYRRKKVKDSIIISEICVEWDSDCSKMICCSKNCPYKNDKKNISIYHRDSKNSYGWSGNVPYNYRKTVIREYKAKMKAEVRRIIVQGDYENYSFNKWYTDFGYYYW
jgi:hypothetical protein